MTTVTDILPAAPAGDDETAARAVYIAGIRALADRLDASPDVPLPFPGRLGPVVFHFLGDDDPIPALFAAALALGGPWRWNVRDYPGSGGCCYFDLAGDFRGLEVQLTAFLDAACERDGDEWRPRPGLAAVLGADDAETEAA
jgi:hypothetical protein